jgi:hypothetical protein
MGGAAVVVHRGSRGYCRHPATADSALNVGMWAAAGFRLSVTTIIAASLIWLLAFQPLFSYMSPVWLRLRPGCSSAADSLPGSRNSTVLRR